MGGAKPVEWSSEDVLATQLGKPLRYTAFRDTITKYSGQSSIRLRSDTANRPDNLTNYSGFLCYCDIFIDPLAQNQSFRYKPFKARPDSLIFWYKYSPGVNNNKALVVFESYNKNLNKIGEVEKEFGEAKNWKRISFPINYVSSAIPDSLFISFTSSFEDPSTVKDTLWLDDISLFFKTVGIMQLNADEVFTLYPNPAVDFVIAEMPGENEYTVTIYNVEGKEVFKQEGVSKRIEIDLTNLSKQSYIIRVFNSATKVFAERKIVKQ